MKIRELQPSEWKSLRDLYLELLKADPGAFADEHDEIAARTEKEWLESLGRAGKTFVAEDGGKLVGMGRVNLYEELPGVPVLHKLGVLPAYRGKGIAKALVAAREEWARSIGAKKLRLYVVADRVKTIEFSAKNGYTIVETQKGGTTRNDGSKVDVVIMEKSL